MSLFLLSILGCGKQDNAALGSETDPVSTSPDPEARLFLEVTPVDEFETGGTPRAFPAVVVDPQTDTPLDVELQRPFLLEGLLEGTEVEASARATLPGVDGPIDAIIHFRTPTLTATQLGSTDSDGFFAVPVIQSDYLLTVVPESPNAPLTTLTALPTADDPTLILELDQGVPLYGQVTRAGVPLENAPVEVSTVDGIEGATARTDEEGWYEIRVAQGDYMVRSFGSGDGLDPVIVESVTTTSQGARVDFGGPAPANFTVAGRVLDSAGRALRQVPFRLRATSLTGYETNASAEVTGFTDNNGNLFTRGVPGTYVLEVFAEAGTNLSSKRYDVDIADNAVDIGDIELSNFSAVDGSVFDPSGAPVPSSSITCTELGFLGRQWTTVTDDAGRWQMQVPDSPVSCAATPPLDRPDLALTRLDVDALSRDEVLVVLEAGARLFGVVSFEGQPEEFALVEVRDGAGRLWASSLTDTDGTFSLRVAVP